MVHTDLANYQLKARTLSIIEQAIVEHALPSHFIESVRRFYAPIAAEVAQLQAHRDQTIVVGIQGTQGSGKSTMADFLKLLLHYDCDLTVAVVSIDDFYLTAADRQHLGNTVHPLLSTRGVPGTHDLPLAFNTLNKLSQIKMGEYCALPRFNKAIDDRAPRNDWPSVSGPVDVIIFEGWCIGIPPQPLEDLVNPMNKLELNEDADGRWRQFVNHQLGGDYAKLFNTLDYLVAITAPSFDVVFEWRSLQEQKLAEKLKNAPPEQQAKLQNETQLRRFIAHYQRLTCHGLKSLPAIADSVVHLDSTHAITEIELAKSTLHVD